MILRIFHCAQYFNEPSAAYLDIKSLPMGGFPHDLALIGVQVVERCVIYENQSWVCLDLVKDFSQKEDNYDNHYLQRILEH